MFLYIYKHFLCIRKFPNFFRVNSFFTSNFFTHTHNVADEMDDEGKMCTHEKKIIENINRKKLIEGTLTIFQNGL